MRAWQAAQVGLARCCSIFCRTVRRVKSVSLLSGNGGTLGGGGGGGAPITFSSTHLPRSTGDVRLGSDVTIRIAPLPKIPQRFSSVRVTRRKRLPYTLG